MPIALFALLIAMVSAWQARREIETHLPKSEIRERHLSANMLVWHQAAVSWRQSHPGFSGSIPPGSLALPIWFVPLASWHSIAAGATVATYASPSDGVKPAPLAAQLAVTTGNSINAGLNASGLIHPPGRSAVVQMSSVVPEGAAVIVTLVTP